MSFKARFIIPAHEQRVRPLDVSYTRWLFRQLTCALIHEHEGSILQAVGLQWHMFTEVDQVPTDVYPYICALADEVRYAYPHGLDRSDHHFVLEADAHASALALRYAEEVLGE